MEGPKDTCTQWLVTSSMGDGDAMDSALRHEGLTPVGGVAVPLQQQSMLYYLWLHFHLQTLIQSRHE